MLLSSYSTLYPIASQNSLIDTYVFVLSLNFLSYLSIELSSKKTNPVLKIGCILYLMAYWIFLYVVKNTSETYPYTSKILGID